MKFDENFKNNNFHRNISITPAFARIHAHICADGYICISRVRRSKKELLEHPRKQLIRNRYYFRYVNTDETLAKQFIRDIKEVFGRKAVKTKKCEYDVSSKWTYDILKNNGALKSHDWFIPGIILNSGELVRKEWLKSFFDDEAHVPLKRKRIEVNCVNKKGLAQIKKMLFSLGISSILRGPYWCRGFSIYRLCIGSKDVGRYHELIGFNSLKKKKRLENLIK